MKVRLEVSHAKANVKRVVLTRDAVIGRSPECNLRIAAGQVSRKHCTMLVSDRGVFIRDHGSSNGTFVAGQRIEAHADVPVPPGTHLNIGGVRFDVRYELEDVNVGADANMLGSTVHRKSEDTLEPQNSPVASAEESAVVESPPGPMPAASGTTPARSNSEDGDEEVPFLAEIVEESEPPFLAEIVETPTEEPAFPVEAVEESDAVPPFLAGVAEESEDEVDGFPILADGVNESGDQIPSPGAKGDEAVEPAIEESPIPSEAGEDTDDDIPFLAEVVEEAEDEGAFPVLGESAPSPPVAAPKPPTAKPVPEAAAPAPDVPKRDEAREPTAEAPLFSVDPEIVEDDDEPALATTLDGVEFDDDDVPIFDFDDGELPDAEPEEPTTPVPIQPFGTVDLGDSAQNIFSAPDEPEAVEFPPEAETPALDDDAPVFDIEADDSVDEQGIGSFLRKLDN